MRLITIVINVDHAEEDVRARFLAAASIMDYIANNFVVTTLAEQGQPYENSTIPIVNGNYDQIKAIATSDLKIIQRIGRDRKSTRLNSSHVCISYAVFCLKKKKIIAVNLDETTDRKSVV